MAGREHAHGQRANCARWCRGRRPAARTSAGSSGPPSRVGDAVAHHRVARGQQSARRATQAATWPGLWPGVGTQLGACARRGRARRRRPPRRRPNGRAGAAARALGRRRRRTARRRARRSARSARGSCARDRPTSGEVGGAGEHARVRVARPASRPCRRDGRLSGCVMQHGERATAEPVEQRQQLRRGRRRAGRCRRPARASSPAITTWRTMRGPSSCSQLQTPSASSWITRPASTAVEQGVHDQRRRRSPARPTCSGRGAARRTRSARSNVSSARERERHRRDRGALDEQLLEARRRTARSAAPAMRSSSAAASSATSPNAPGAPHARCGALVDLLARRVALREPLHGGEQVVDAHREQVAVEHPGAPSRARTRSAALSPVPRRSGASTAQPRARALAAPRRRERARLAALVERDQHAREPRRPSPSGSSEHRVERHARRDVERQPLARSRPRARRGS